MWAGEDDDDDQADRGRTSGMSSDSRAWRQAGLLAPGLAAIMLLAAACGGGRASTGSVKPRGQITVQQLDSFAACMRGHGLSNFRRVHARARLPRLPGAVHRRRLPDQADPARQHRYELAAVPGCREDMQ
jgi:hypothetical protein